MATSERFARGIRPGAIGFVLAAALVACGGGKTLGDESVAAQYVKLALAHEAHGKQEYRQELLEAALLIAPDYAPAHWHLGHVKLDDEWVPAAEVQRRAEQDPTLSTYTDLRDKALDDPRRELALAKWCQKEQWDDRADLHFAGVALSANADRRLRNEAVRRLDLVEVNGELLTREELESLREVADRVKKAMKKWRGQLEKWRQQIELNVSPGNDNAAAELAQVDDPDVIPVIESFLPNSGATFGEQIVRLLGSFPQHDATRTLVHFAVLSPWQNVRDAAIEQLKRRSLHDYVPMLLDGLVAPIRSQFLITRSPDGVVHYRHVFLQRDAEGNRLTAREHVARPALMQLPASRNPVTSNETPWDAFLAAQDRARLEAIRVAYEAWQYEQALGRGNAAVLANNEPIFVALERTTGEVLGRDPADWQAWWQSYNEVLTEKPTYYEYYPTQSTFASYYQRDLPPAPPSRPGGTLFTAGRGSCFAAGTPVWTETGLLPIEKVRIGDRVLSQDPDSGELAYKVVLRTTALAPTSATVRVTVEGESTESIDMTRAHVVWVAEEGWRMAKELKVGDRLHAPGGILRIKDTEQLPPELEVYNLVVADFNTFFVGENAVLVHDITYRKPTRTAVPGLVWGEP